jgi:hypothetical protein
MAVRVADSGIPSLSATQTFVVTVNEVNNAPVLAPLLSRTVNEGTSLLVTNFASDPDDDGHPLTFSLDPVTPEGMVIDPESGIISWTPSEVQGPGTYIVTVRVSDAASTEGGQVALSDSKQLTVFVAEINAPPKLAPLNDWTVAVGSVVEFTATATDVDFPPQLLTFALTSDTSPEGGLALNSAAEAALDPNTGWFSWVPGPDRASTTNVFTVTVDDHGSPAMTNSRNFSVVVRPQLIAAITRDDEALLVRVASTPGRTYRLEFKGRLTDEDWTPASPDTVAGSASVTFTNSVEGTPQRFYRVVEME